MISALGQLLTFRAFQPPFGDACSHMAERFANRRVAAVVASPSHLRVATLAFRGREPSVSDEEVVPIQFGSPLPGEAARAIAARSDCRCMALSMTSGFTMTLLNALRRTDAAATHRRLRSAPREVIGGGNVEPGRSYALHHHPRFQSSLLCSIPAEEIRNTEKNVVAPTGLQLVRLQSACFAMVAMAFDGRELPAGHDLAVCDGTSVACVRLKPDGDWQEVRFRTDVFSAGAVSRAGDEFLGRAINRDRGLLLLEAGSALEERLAAQMPGLAVTRAQMPGGAPPDMFAAAMY